MSNEAISSVGEATFESLIIQKSFQVLQVLANAITICAELHLQIKAGIFKVSRQESELKNGPLEIKASPYCSDPGALSPFPESQCLAQTAWLRWMLQSLTYRYV